MNDLKAHSLSKADIASTAARWERADPLAGFDEGGEAKPSNTRGATSKQHSQGDVKVDNNKKKPYTTKEVSHNKTTTARPDLTKEHGSIDFTPDTKIAIIATVQQITNELVKLHLDAEDASAFIKHLIQATKLTPPSRGRPKTNLVELVERAMRPGPEFRVDRSNAKRAIEKQGYRVDTLPLLVKQD